jgi:integrase/recombinase XerD
VSATQWKGLPNVSQDALADEWLRRVSTTRSRRTVAAYGRCLEAYLGRCQAEGIGPLEASHETVVRFLEAILYDSEKHIVRSEATARLHHSVLRQFYNHLRQTGRWTHAAPLIFPFDDYELEVPASRVVKPTVSRTNTPISPESWAAVLSAAREETWRDRTMFLLQYEAGLRPGELTGLAQCDLDIGGLKLRIKGGKGGPRSVRISSITSPIYQAHLESAMEAVGRGGPLFSSMSNRNVGEPISTSAWAKVISRIRANSGVMGFSSHAIRRMRTAHLFNTGVDVYRLASDLGYTNLHYARETAVAASSSTMDERAGGSELALRHAAEALFPKAALHSPGEIQPKIRATARDTSKERSGR